MATHGTGATLLAAAKPSPPLTMFRFWTRPTMIAVLVFVIGVLMFFSGDLFTSVLYSEYYMPEAWGTKHLALDAKETMAHLEAICAIGPRPSGSLGMEKQQELLTQHFTKLGGRVTRQEFMARHPVTGKEARLANLIVEWHPERTERVLICCHYDTRPFPDRDRNNPRGVFIGANDGGSGCAVLMEMGKLMAKLPTKYGVDFVFFDGEEFVIGEVGKYFLGSEHFALEYKANPPQHTYRYGVLLDMVGDRALKIYQEKTSLKYPETAKLVANIWDVARRESVREFIARPKWEVKDDHIPLNEIAGIPTCDIIDFDYPQWHTEYDTPKACSGPSMAKVGHVVVKWLEQVK